jgi:hypothetical protein
MFVLRKYRSYLESPSLNKGNRLFMNIVDLININKSGYDIDTILRLIKCYLSDETFNYIYILRTKKITISCKFENMSYI